MLWRPFSITSCVPFCFLGPSPSCLLHPHPSGLLCHQAWNSPWFPWTLGEHCPPRLSLTDDRVVPGGAQGSVWGGHGGPAPAPPGCSHAGLWGGSVLWRHPSLWEWTVPPTGHQHPGPRQDQVSVVNTLGEEGAGSILPGTGDAPTPCLGGKMGIILKPTVWRGIEEVRAWDAWQGEGLTCRGRQRPDQQSLGVLNREVILGLKSNAELPKGL